jgi:DNA polymerase-3 subunit epsilon
MNNSTEFAVVDVETTGLFPGRGDRIIEIAAIRIDTNGTIIKEYETLVNPDRDLGPTPLHGITAKEVMKAPLFEEIAGDVIDVISGAIFVAHNVQFDWRFIQAEMERVGCTLPQCTCLCTIHCARIADPCIPGRNLEVLCDHFGITLKRAHSAYHDARAAAELLKLCLNKVGASSQQLYKTGLTEKPMGKTDWPKLPVSGRTYKRDRAAQEIASAPSYISQLVSRLPVSCCSSPEMDEYLSLLDQVLEDRRVTSEESEILFNLATDLGIDRRQVIAAHHEYMRELIEAALEDGIITDSEQRDLEEIQKLLVISPTDYSILLDKVSVDYESGNARRRSFNAGKKDIIGKTICFTGAMRCCIDGRPASRAMAERLAAEKGMIVKKGVTKKLNFLVAADPDSMSGKAKKARQYGIRIIAESVFWRMMGVTIE